MSTSLNISSSRETRIYEGRILQIVLFSQWEMDNNVSMNPSGKVLVMNNSYLLWITSLAKHVYVFMLKKKKNESI